MLTFYGWLVQQAGRDDPIGAFARQAAKDKIFPRTRSELFVVLMRYHGMPDQRSAAKTAHREWRRAKQDAAA